MNNKITRFFTCALLALAGINYTFATPVTQAQPNIVLIMIDDIGYETITANGGQSYQTPNLDQLAEQGVRFTHAFSQPLCTPSRVKLMTGDSNIRNYIKFGKLARTETTFANLLQKAGYKTAIAGKWQLGTEHDGPQHFGFDESLLWQHTTKNSGTTRPELKHKHDSRYPNPELQRNGKMEYFNQGEYGPDVMADYLVGFIEKNKNAPFLAYYPMILTHAPFEPTPDSKGWDARKWGALKYRGDGDRSYQQKNFADMVTYMDKIVGKITGTIDRLGLRENTLLMVIGDNGTDWPIQSQWNGITVKGAKGMMEDAGVRVPMIVSWPGKIKNGLVSDELIEFSDFLPTMLDVSGTPFPKKYSNDGTSFLPTLLGQPGRKKESVHIWHHTKNHNIEVMVRNKQYSLVKKQHKDKKLELKFYDERLPFQSKELQISRLNKVQKIAYEQLTRRMVDFKKLANKEPKS